MSKIGWAFYRFYRILVTVYHSFLKRECDFIYERSMIIFDRFVVVCERFYLRIFLKRSEKSEHSKALEQIAKTFTFTLQKRNIN
jgi:hypothetical protein